MSLTSIALSPHKPMLSLILLSQMKIGNANLYRHRMRMWSLIGMRWRVLSMMQLWKVLQRVLVFVLGAMYILVIILLFSNIMNYSTGSMSNPHQTLQPHPEQPLSWHLQLNVNDHTLIHKPPLLSRLVLSQLPSPLLQTQTPQRLALGTSVMHFSPKELTYNDGAESLSQH